MNIQRLAAAYFVFQSLAGLTWWIAISRDLALAEMFFPVANATRDLTTFQFADLTWFVGGSGLAGLLIWRESRFAYPVVWVLAGAVGYATFCTFGLLLNGGRLLSIAMMLGSLTGTLYFATHVPRDQHDSKSELERSS